VLALTRDETLNRTSAVPHPCTDAHVSQWIADNKAGPRSALTFAIRSAAEVVGAVTLKRLEASDNSGELAYWVGTPHQRKGYAVRGARLALDYAFDELLLDYVHSHSLKKSNEGSVKTLRALGFVPDSNKQDIPTEGRFAAKYGDDHWTFFRLDRPADITGAAKVYSRRWDAMMTDYCGRRTSCFELVEELMRQMLSGEALKVLDLGCGTAQFTVRQLAYETPARRMTAIDGSAKNLMVAKSVIGADPRVTFVQADLTTGGWSGDMATGTFDAAFLGWVTHEIEPWHLPTLYANVAKLLRPGGLLFNVDFMDGLQPSWRSLSGDYQRRRVSPDFAAHSVRSDALPPVAAAIASDKRTKTRWNVRHTPATHMQLLRDAGFVESEEVWRYLGYSMVMGVR
jgi:RimJ/RimL family protein N-acetyltransferase/ubiquinone/menaquinone biosynthesis C-methylase UbiE